MTGKTNISHECCDGFGHQLLGLLSIMSRHGVNNYYFDGPAFLKKNMYIAHLKGKDFKETVDYIQEAVYNFSKDNSQIYYPYRNVIYSNQLKHIPKKIRQSRGSIPQYDYIAQSPSPDNADTLYTLDTTQDWGLPNNYPEYESNIKKVCQYFKVNRLLPPNRLKNDNIVFHIRLGDRINLPEINKLNKYYQKLQKVTDKVLDIYPTYHIYIHSDGNPTQLIKILNQKNKKYTLFDSTTPFLNLWSDLIYAQILVMCDSSLSRAAAVIGDHEAVVTTPPFVTIGTNIDGKVLVI